MSDYQVFDYSEMMLDIEQRVKKLHLMCLNKKFDGYQEEIVNINDAVYCLQQWMQTEAQKAA